MTTKSAEELKSERISLMGPKLGLLYDHVYNDYFYIRSNWVIYNELYGKSEDVIKILNNSAPLLFYNLQQILLEHIILGIAKITDPKGSIGKMNVSFNAIKSELTDAAFSEKVEVLLNAITEQAVFCRDWRNRKIAHSDMRLVESPLEKPLEIANRKKIREVMDSLLELINCFQLEYFKATSTSILIEEAYSRDIHILLTKLR